MKTKLDAIFKYYLFQQMWPDMTEVRLVWHYLAFDRAIVSARTKESLAELTEKTCRFIDEIEAAEEFPPKESALCEWCRSWRRTTTSFAVARPYAS